MYKAFLASGTILGTLEWDALPPKPKSWVLGALLTTLIAHEMSHYLMVRQISFQLIFSIIWDHLAAHHFKAMILIYMSISEGSSSISLVSFKRYKCTLVLWKYNPFSGSGQFNSKAFNLNLFATCYNDIININNKRGFLITPFSFNKEYDQPNIHYIYTLSWHLAKSFKPRLRCLFWGHDLLEYGQVKFSTIDKNYSEFSFANGENISR